MEEKETKEVEVTETETPTSKTTTTQTVEVKKKRSKLPYILGCFFLSICICCLCVILSFGSLVGVIFNGVDEVVEDFVAICDADESELMSIYENNFSRSYQRETSYEEFVAFYNRNSEFFDNTCGDLTNLNFQDLANGFDFSIDDDTAVLTLNTEDGELNLKAVQEREGEWKIDELTIE